MKYNGYLAEEIAAQLRYHRRVSPYMTTDQRINSLLHNFGPDVRIEIRNMPVHVQADLNLVRGSSEFWRAAASP